MHRRPQALVLTLALIGFGLIGSPVLAQCVDDQLLPGDPTMFSEFGSAVAIDGDVVVVGAWNDDEAGSDAGAAYVFRFDGSNWNEEAKLVPSDGEPNDLFGHTVAVSGDLVVVGGYAGVQIGIINGAAYVYRFDGSSWNEEAILSTSAPALADFFSYSVAVSGSRIAVGDPGNSIFFSPAGKVFIYEYDGAIWNETDVVSASDATDWDSFGWSIALEGDRLAVGAPSREGAGEDRGGLYLYEFDGVSWVEEILEPAVTADFDRLGTAVSLDGDRVAAGALQVDGFVTYGSGKILVFNGAGGAPWIEEATLSSSVIGDGDGFGSAMALAGDQVYVGAPESGNNGRMARFSFDGIDWQAAGTIVPSETSFSDKVGYAVAADAGRFVIAAPRHDEPVVNAGTCFVYELDFAEVDFLRGDANGDSLVDVGDAVWVLAYIFQSGQAPSCLRAADTNGDSLVDLGDAIYLINYNFLSGPPPPTPFPTCGLAGVPSPLCCASSSCP